MPRSLAPVFVLALTLAPLAVQADVVQLQPNHPTRYVVQKRDTLWGISQRFLKDPWLWPRIWNINQQIANPHLIYPGDVIYLRMVHGQPQLTLLREEKVAPPGAPTPAAPAAAPPTPLAPPPEGLPVVKLEPTIRSTPAEAPIPTIPPSAIMPFLTQPLLVDQAQLDAAGYVAAGQDERHALGTQDQFYARGLKGSQHEYYQIVRPGKPLKDPGSGEVLAYQAVYVGDAKVEQYGDPAKLLITRADYEVEPGDRLLPRPETPPLPYYYPHAPAQPVHGVIIAAPGALDPDLAQYAVVALNLGRRNGIENGDVLEVLRQPGSRTDPVTGQRFRLPAQRSGLAMVFRTFNKVSYALILETTRPVHILDAVATP